MGLQLLFPKFVVVKNAYLVALYHTLVALLFIALVARFRMASQYAQFVSIAQYVYPVIVPCGEEEDIRAQADATLGGFGCEPGATDYWWDPSGAFEFTNFTCANICSQGQTSGCVPVDWTATQENGHTIFFPTSVETVSLDTNTPVKHFILGTEALAVALTYSLSIPTFTWLVEQLAGDSSYYFQGSSTSNVLTVVLDSEDNLDHYHYPEQGVHIQLTISKLIELSGAMSTLEDYLPEMGANFFQGAAHPEGPHVRISGMELIVELNCQQWPTLSPKPPDWVDHTCYLRVVPVWSWSRIDRFADTLFGHKKFHGLRVRVRTSGVFEFLSFESCFWNFISALVLMKLPRTFVRLFAVHCLGGLSRIYKKVVYETFSLSDQIAGTLTRLMVSSLSFIKLRDTQGGISKDQFALACIAALKRGQLITDPEAIREIVKISFGALHKSAERKHSRPGLGRKWTKLKKLFVGSQDGRREKAHVMDVDGFVDVCGNLDHVHFDDVVNLLDRSRNVSFLERLFTPKMLRAHEDRARAHSTDPGLEEDMMRIRSTETVWGKIHENSDMYHTEHSAVSKPVGMERTEDEDTFMRQIAARVFKEEHDMFIRAVDAVPTTPRTQLRTITLRDSEAEVTTKKKDVALWSEEGADARSMWGQPDAKLHSSRAQSNLSLDAGSAVMALSMAKHGLVLDPMKDSRKQQDVVTTVSSTEPSKRRRRGTKATARRTFQAFMRVSRERAKDQQRFRQFQKATIQMASKYDAAISILKAEIEHLELSMNQDEEPKARSNAQVTFVDLPDQANASVAELEKKIKSVRTLIQEASMESMAQIMDLENVMDRRLHALEAQIGRQRQER